jgi:hypothetical protein
MADEALGCGLEIVVHQRKQAEPGAQHERAFQSLEHPDNTYATDNPGHRGIGLTRFWGHAGGIRTSHEVVYMCAHWHGLWSGRGPPMNQAYDERPLARII